MNNISSLLLLLLLLGSGCISKSHSYDPVRNYVDDEKNLVTQFILAEDSSVIELKQGHFTINESLILDNKRNVVIKGQGVDKTILSFKNQTQGAEGILIKNCEKQGITANFYIHSWELTPEYMPKLDLPFKDNFVTFHNIDKAYQRMNDILKEFSFTSFSNYLSQNAI